MINLTQRLEQILDLNNAKYADNVPVCSTNGNPGDLDETIPKELEDVRWYANKKD